MRVDLSKLWTMTSLASGLDAVTGVRILARMLALDKEPCVITISDIDGASKLRWAGQVFFWLSLLRDKGYRISFDRNDIDRLMEKIDDEELKELLEECLIRVGSIR